MEKYLLWLWRKFYYDYGEIFIMTMKKILLWLWGNIYYDYEENSILTMEKYLLWLWSNIYYGYEEMFIMIMMINWKILSQTKKRMTKNLEQYFGASRKIMVSERDMSIHSEFESH